MSRTLHLTFATVVAAGMLATTPALAQQNQDGVAAPSRDGTVPFRLSAGQIGQMQRKLAELGFSPGRVDGIWGPETSAAVLRFQQKRSLQASGKLDDATFRALGLATTASPSPVDAAPAAPPQATTAPVPASPTPPIAPGGSVTGNPSATAPGTTPGGTAGAAAASGDTNQAVATTRSNARLSPPKARTRSPKTRLRRGSRARASRTSAA